jgi:hypothetical protein
MEGTLVRFLGESGVIRIIAPLPPGEAPELPIIFVANTFAKTLEPQGRLKGGVVNAATGTRQDLSLTT